MRAWVRTGFAMAFAFALSGCVHPTRMSAVPSTATTKAQIFDIPNARFFLDAEGVRAMNAEAQLSMARERARAGGGSKVSLLALSGGGDDGAFGAGVITGWTKSGARPQFKLVTGISTGALIAPFAFVGPEYDDALRAVFTQTTQADIFTKRTILAALTDDALADTTPLFNLITHYIDERMLERIAEEYRKGRVLLIGTTNLDAARPVIWNIGALAESRDPRSRELIRRILLASAAIPAAFPPVMFDVAVDGQSFHELHVDGGAVAQTFLYPPMLRPPEGAQRRAAAYVVRNGRIAPPWEDVQRQTLSIAGRAISSLISSNAIGDLYIIYSTTKRDGVDFNVTYIDDDFKTPYKGPFDKDYMNKLFDYGYAQGARGGVWRKTPPFFGGLSAR